jgi:hypothetical protein
MMKTRRIKGAGNVARFGEKRNAYRSLVGKPEGKRPLRGPRHKDIHGWIILKWILRDRMGWYGLD